MKNALERILFLLYPYALSLRFRNTTVFRALLPLLVSTEPERMLFFAMDFAAAAHTGGDYLEFGSYAGGSVSLAYHYAQQVGLNGMRFYCFDSFEGLPATEGTDTGPFFKKGEYRCGLPTFMKNLKRRGASTEKITPVKGWYADTLNAATKKILPLRKAAVILVDCDLYASAAQALEFVTDYVADGTLIIFDDWFNFAGSPERGERKAFGEWLGRHPEITATEYHKIGWGINSFVLHKKAFA